MKGKVSSFQCSLFRLVHSNSTLCPPITPQEEETWLAWQGERWELIENVCFSFFFHSSSSNRRSSSIATGEEYRHTDRHYKACRTAEAQVFSVLSLCYSCFRLACLLCNTTLSGLGQSRGRKEFMGRAGLKLHFFEWTKNILKNINNFFYA